MHWMEHVIQIFSNGTAASIVTRIAIANIAIRNIAVRTVPSWSSNRICQLRCTQIEMTTILSRPICRCSDQRIRRTRGTCGTADVLT